jgi:hypothetical protein
MSHEIAMTRYAGLAMTSENFVKNSPGGWFTGIESRIGASLQRDG